MADDNPHLKIFSSTARKADAMKDPASRDLGGLLSQAVIATALDAIVVIDDEGCFVAFNEAAEQLFGHAVDDVLGRPMAELIIPPDLRGAHHGGLERFVKTGEKRVIGSRVEVPALHATGKTIWVELTVAPVPFEGKHYFTAYIRDITQRREQEEALKESENRYSELFQNSVDAIIIHDLDGRIHDVNAQAVSLLGRSVEELLETPLPHLHPESDHPKAKRAIHEVKETGRTRMEISFVHSSGRIIPTEINARRFENGSEVLVQGIVRDQTEQAQAQAERERYQRLLSSAESIAQLGSWMWDLDTGEILWSKTTYDIFGMDPDVQVTIDSYTACIHPDDLQLLRKKISHAALTGEGYEIEYRIIRPDGGEVIVRSQAEAEREREGGNQTRRLLGTIQDITDMRRAQDALEAARDAAEAANRAKTAFLANMSHEMRTPLNGVIGSLSLMEAKSLDREDRNHLGRARRSAESAVTLVNDLMDISRIEAGEIMIEPALFAPSDLLQQTQDMFSSNAQFKGVELKVSGDENMPVVLGDAGRIRQVIFNLVGNALKFTDEGGVEVSIETRGSGAYIQLHVEVTDTGPGVPEHMLKSLFERFQQADVSKSRMHGGVGLGLAISRELVLAMGGDINLENRPQGGARAWFSIPLLPGKADLKDDKPTAEPSDVLNGHVLLAEDSATNAAVATAMLERFGLTSDLAQNGAEAVSMALSGTYDLILMDMAMPVKDGLDATRELRAAGYEGPIIALTAHAMPESRDEALEAGVSAYITKPLNMGLLKQALTKWVSRPEGALIDLDDKHKRWDGMETVYAEIGAIFLTELSDRLATIETAFEEGDCETVGLNAHALKGGAENLAATQLFKAARALEYAARDGTASRTALSVLKRVAAQTEQALRAQIRSQ